VSVTATTEPGPAGDPRLDPPAPPPARRLWWMYLLVLLALAAMGAGAAQAWGLTHDGTAAGVSARCLLGQGLSGFAIARIAADPSATSLIGLNARGINACLAPLDRLAGIEMIGGAVALPAAAYLLMLAGGLALRRRLRTRRSDLAQAPAGMVATARFEAWCEAWGLSGGRRPRLVLAAPGR
jgi:hypothetical protein